MGRGQLTRAVDGGKECPRWSSVVGHRRRREVLVVSALREGREGVSGGEWLGGGEEVLLLRIIGLGLTEGAMVTAADDFDWR